MSINFITLHCPLIKPCSITAVLDAGSIASFQDNDGSYIDAAKSVVTMQDGRVYAVEEPVSQIIDLIKAS